MRNFREETSCSRTDFAMGIFASSTEPCYLSVHLFVYLPDQFISLVTLQFHPAIEQDRKLLRQLKEDSELIVF